MVNPDGLGVNRIVKKWLTDALCNERRLQPKIKSSRCFHTGVAVKNTPNRRDLCFSEKVMDVFWGLTAAAWTAVAAIGTMASAISAAGTPMTNTSQNRLDL